MNIQLRTNHRYRADQLGIDQSIYSGGYQAAEDQVCEICQCEYLEDQMREFGICKHRFCNNCIHNHVQACVGSLKLPVCPHYGCTTQLDFQGPLFHSLDAPLQAKVLKVKSYRKVLSNPMFKPCMLLDCSGVINIKQSLKCTICDTLHCKSCYRAAHPGECESKVAVQLQMTRKYRQCGKCGQIIEKTEGCTHMTCTCGNYFCYSCGEPLIGDHQCKAPQDLNCMQTLRWQIQHLQFWYENASCTLLRILLMFSPPTSLNKCLKALWITTFSVTLYPLLVFAALVLALASTGVFIGLTLLLTLLIPFNSFCSGGLQLFPNFQIAQSCGCCIALILILIFYPLFYIINLIQILVDVIDKEGANILIPLIELAQGVKLVVLFPCLMTVDNQQFYLNTYRIRDNQENEPQPIVQLAREVQG